MRLSRSRSASLCPDQFTESHQSVVALHIESELLPPPHIQASNRRRSSGPTPDCQSEPGVIAGVGAAQSRYRLTGGTSMILEPMWLRKLMIQITRSKHVATELDCVQTARVKPPEVPIPAPRWYIPAPRSEVPIPDPLAFSPLVYSSSPWRPLFCSVHFSYPNLRCAFFTVLC